MPFVSRLVFWLGLLYFGLPCVCAEPSPELVRGGGGGVAVLLGGIGPSLSLAGTLDRDDGGGEEGAVDVLLVGVGPSLSLTGTLAGDEGGRVLGTSLCWAENF